VLSGIKASTPAARSLLDPASAPGSQTRRSAPRNGPSVSPRNDPNDGPHEPAEIRDGQDPPPLKFRDQKTPITHPFPCSCSSEADRSGTGGISGSSSSGPSFRTLPTPLSTGQIRSEPSGAGRSNISAPASASPSQKGPICFLQDHRHPAMQGGHLHVGFRDDDDGDGKRPEHSAIRQPPAFPDPGEAIISCDTASSNEQLKSARRPRTAGLASSELRRAVWPASII
jgi:hypothetical protein